MNYNWNWGVFLQPAADGSGTWAMTLAYGLCWTFATAALAWVLALFLGTIVGVASTLRNRAVQAAAATYVEIFRNIPVLVQLFLWYFVLPEVVPAALGTWLKQLPNASFYTAAIGVGFYMSARVAEQLRSGLNALPRGQKQAGLAMGLTTAQTYRHVLLPVAFRTILPPLTSEFLNTIKNSAVALTIGLAELTSRAYAIQENTFQFFEAFTAATVIYLVVNLLVTTGMRRLEARIQIPGTFGGK
ncbi:glutamate ABC transporter permease [Brucella pseudogrignonensis]|uniref:amino acid ABC transporter permease n=1 Tax=Brucella pseudogrignonensis TaxID=419475 RepID=UPI0007DA7581|nr:amino acid ABC transporter permease [Brucella pseudogrignonensis]ANG98693.1 glutamate ABC transporter permease [Brucella pseudogrignonensis]